MYNSILEEVYNNAIFIIITLIILCIIQAGLLYLSNNIIKTKSLMIDDLMDEIDNITIANNGNLDLLDALPEKVKESRLRYVKDILKTNHVFSKLDLHTSSLNFEYMDIRYKYFYKSNKLLVIGKEEANKWIKTNSINYIIKNVING